MGKSFLYGVLFLIWMFSAAFAMADCGAGPCASCHNLTLKEANELLRGVGEVKKIQLSPVTGLWLLNLEKDGRQGVVFMDFGKKNLIAGTVFPLANKETKRPTAGDAKEGRVDVAAIPLADSIVMGNPKGNKKLFVFTDPDCPFCARMHGELKKLVAMDTDVAVYIKMFPLKMHPNAYDKARMILGENSRELLEKAFDGTLLPTPGAKDGKKPVDETIRFAQSIGIDSTPTLVLPDGRIMPGVRDAKTLAKLMAGEN